MENKMDNETCTELFGKSNDDFKQLIQDIKNLEDDNIHNFAKENDIKIDVDKKNFEIKIQKKPLIELVKPMRLLFKSKKDN